MTSEDRPISFFFDADENLVLIQSPCTGAWHGSTRQSMLDSVQWLRSDKWKAGVWGHLHMVFNYHSESRVLVTCENGGGHPDFIAFSTDETEFQGQVGEFCRAIERFEMDVVKPYAELRSQGKSNEDAGLLVRNLHAFDLKPIWQAGEGVSG